MSQADKTKWNTRYSEGAYAQRTDPSAILQEYVPEILASHLTAPGQYDQLRALDIACGAGRNTLYLARCGYHVDAVDIAFEGLKRGKTTVDDQPLSIRWIEHDLDNGLPNKLTHYDIIVVVRYLDMASVRAAVNLLKVDGYLICEVHLATQESVAGPSGNNFRAASGQLKDAAHGLEIVSYWEGITQDPDGQSVSLARLVAKRVSD